MENNLKYKKYTYMFSKISSLILLLVFFPIIIVFVGISQQNLRNEKTHWKINIQSDIVDQSLSSYNVIEEKNLNNYFSDDTIWEIYYYDSSILEEVNVVEYFVEDKTLFEGIDFSDGIIEEELITILKYSSNYSIKVSTYSYDESGTPIELSSINYEILGSDYLPSDFYNDIGYVLWVVIVLPIFFALLITSFILWKTFLKYKNIEGEEV